MRAYNHEQKDSGKDKVEEVSNPNTGAEASINTKKITDKWGATSRRRINSKFSVIMFFKTEYDTSANNFLVIFYFSRIFFF